ncbi:MAG: DnaJ domain-containing protein, partial [Nitrospira sp.]|nr:DnaJ domain-containing protein [Nitrospira sp.]
MRDKPTTNYYALLELLPTATEVEIKKAWHEQIQVWHPDRFTHAPTLHRKAEARTTLLNQAYQTLSDPTARARYDATIHPSSAPTAGAHPSPSPSEYASTPRRQTPRSRDARGPQTLLMLSQQGTPKVMVPAIHLYVDPREHAPYNFDGFVRIAG